MEIVIERAGRSTREPNDYDSRVVVGVSD